MARTPEPITGTAAGVPFIAIPPVADPTTAPVVLGWHLMDPPRTEVAFAAALPLAGLDAWRVYFGLPLTGQRLPDGGPEALMQLGYSDAVLNLFGPIADQAVVEFEPAYRHLAEVLGFRDGPLGVLGGSLGAAVALQVLAQSRLPIDVAVLVSPLIQLRPMVMEQARSYGVEYEWTGPADEVAERLDFVARADELAAAAAAVLIITGDRDSDAIRGPAAELAAALSGNGDSDTGVDPDHTPVRHSSIPGMGHALADEPGVDPAPQTAHARIVDRQAAAWIAQYLSR